MTANEPPSAVERPDPNWRRRFVVVVAGLTVLGAGWIVLVDRHGEDIASWLLDDVRRGGWGYRAVVLGLAAGMAGPLVALGWYVIVLGLKVTRSDRFPPPGMAVLRDTPVVTGPPARKRGISLRRLGWFVLGTGLVFGGVFWWILERLLMRSTP